MISEKHILAYKNFVTTELELAEKYRGATTAWSMVPQLYDMYEHIAAHPEEYILFEKSKVVHYEMEFVEEVLPIREKFQALAVLHNIPKEVLYIPRVTVEGMKKVRVIHKKVAFIVRELFDKHPDDEYVKMRNYQVFLRTSKLGLWLQGKEGTTVIATVSQQQAIPKKELVIKLMKLFDDDFVRQQKLWMSQQIWVHHTVVSAYEDLYGKLK